MIVYLATNSVNGMQYVGITSKKLSDRKYGHLKMSKDGKGSPVSIWEAIRQHGAGNFSFKTIETLSDVESLRKREMYWIKRLNTLTPHGYNQNKGGSITTADEYAKKYRINGKSYFGYGQLALAFDLEEGTIRARVKYAGWTLKQAVGLAPPPTRTKEGTKITFRGKTYPSERHLCRDYNVCNNVFRQRYHRCGWTLGEALNVVERRQTRREITVFGKTFKSRTHAAKYYGINPSSVTTRLGKGWTLEKALTLDLLQKGHDKPKISRSYVIHGVTYNSYAEIGAAYGLSMSGVSGRINRNTGKPLNEIFLKGDNNE
jgi:hypothetical protein